MLTSLSDEKKNNHPIGKTGAMTQNHSRTMLNRYDQSDSTANDKNHEQSPLLGNNGRCRSTTMQHATARRRRFRCHVGLLKIKERNPFSIGGTGSKSSWCLSPCPPPFSFSARNFSTAGRPNTETTRNGVPLALGAVVKIYFTILLPRTMTIVGGTRAQT